MFVNTMRRSIHCKLILKKFSKSRPLVIIHTFVICYSQIIYLKIKPYAVVNETVNVAKSKNFSGFVNALLKNI